MKTEIKTMSTVKIWDKVNKLFLRDQDGKLLEFENETAADNYIINDTEIPFSKIEYSYSAFLTEELQDEITVCEYGIEWIEKILELPNVDNVFGDILRAQKTKREYRINEIKACI